MLPVQYCVLCVQTVTHAALRSLLKNRVWPFLDGGQKARNKKYEGTLCSRSTLTRLVTEDERVSGVFAFVCIAGDLSKIVRRFRGGIPRTGGEHLGQDGSDADGRSGRVLVPPREEQEQKFAGRWDVDAVRVRPRLTSYYCWWLWQRETSRSG